MPGKVAASILSADHAYLADQIKLVEQQLEETRKRASVGAASSEEKIPLQREILRLKRELARMD